MSWISRVFGDFDVLEGETHAEELSTESLDADKVRTPDLVPFEMVGSGPHSDLQSPVRDISTGSDHDSFGGVVWVSDTEAVAIYRSGPDHISGGAVALRRSTDGGKTWSSESLIYDSQYDEKPPTPTRLPNGDIIVMFTREDSAGSGGAVDHGYIKSTDGGQTWGSYTTLDPRGWATADTTVATTAKVIELQDGTLACPVYGWNHTTQADSESWIIESTDGGDTWSYTATIVSVASGSTTYVEPWMEQLPNGDLICVHRTLLDSTRVEQFSSTDGGTTWTQDGTIPTFTTTDESEPCLFMSPKTDLLTMVLPHSYLGSLGGWWVDGYPSRFFSYQTADPASVTGDPTVWEDGLWYTSNNSIEGAPKPAVKPNGEMYVSFSYDDPQAVANMAMVGETAITRLLANQSVITYDYTVDTHSIGQGIEAGINSVQEVFNTQAPPTAKTVVTPPKVPKWASSVILEVFFAGDGTASSQAYVDLSPYDKTGYSSIVGKDASSTWLTNHMAEVQLNRDGQFYYSTSNVSDARANVRGFTI